MWENPENLDWKTFAALTTSFWPDRPQAERQAFETLAAASLLKLNGERSFERATRALLERATHRSEGRGPFGLVPEERLILIALHSGRWSYARLGRIFGESEDWVQEISWQARLRVLGSRYPTGAPAATASCPEYDSRRPWTQRFLDDEIRSGQERLFFQNHLMACDSCRAALSRCRDAYYDVDAKVGAWLVADRAGFAERLEQTVSDLVSPEDVSITFSMSLLRFVSRPDVALVLAIGIFAVLFKFSSH